MKIESRSFRHRTRNLPLARDYVVALSYPGWHTPLYLVYRAKTNGKPSEKRLTRLENRVEQRIHERWLRDGVNRQIVWSGEPNAWLSQDFAAEVFDLICI